MPLYPVQEGRVWHSASELGNGRTTGPARKTRRLWRATLGSAFSSEQSEPSSQSLAGGQASSKDLSSSVPRLLQLHPTRHFPDFPVSPEMLMGAPASSAFWHDLVAFPPTFCEIRESGMSFTPWVLLLNSGNQGKHQGVRCPSQERHKMGANQIFPGKTSTLKRAPFRVVLGD